MRQMARQIGLGILLAATSLAAVPAQAASIIVNIASTAGPWLQSQNAALDYGVHDNTAPSSVLAGFDFTAGGLFTISYVSGLTSAFGGVPYSDAGGDTGFVADNTGGSSGLGFPSGYVPAGQYPAYLNEVIGAFADASGTVIGNPFVVGNGPFSIASPAGAAQLLLGLNDDIFADNSGGLVMQVVGPTAAGGVPEPATWVLMIGGLAMAGGALRRRHAVARPALA